MYSQRFFASKSGGNVSKRSAKAVKRAANGRKEPARLHFIDFPPPGRLSSRSRSVRHSRRWDDRSLFTVFYCPPLLPLPLPLPLRSAISPSFCSSHASFIFPLLSAYFFSPPHRSASSPPLPLSLSSCGCQRWNDDHLQPSCNPPPSPPQPTPPTSSSTPTSGEGLRHNDIAHTYVHVCAHARRPCHVEKMRSRTRGAEGRGTSWSSRGRDEARRTPGEVWWRRAHRVTGPTVTVQELDYSAGQRE